MPVKQILRRKLSAREVATCLRVRSQLEALRDADAMETHFTVADYERMDPLWRTTMTGAFAGRVIEFPKMQSMFDRIKADVKKWTRKRLRGRN